MVHLFWSNLVHFDSGDF